MISGWWLPIEIKVPFTAQSYEIEPGVGILHRPFNHTPSTFINSSGVEIAERMMSHLIVFLNHYQPKLKLLCRGS